MMSGVERELGRLERRADRRLAREVRHRNRRKIPRWVRVTLAVVVGALLWLAMVWFYFVEQILLGQPIQL